MDYEILILVIVSIISLIITRCQPLSVVLIAIVFCFLMYNDNHKFAENNFKSSYAISAAAVQNLKKTDNPKFKKIQDTPHPSESISSPSQTASPPSAQQPSKHEIVRPSSSINSSQYSLKGMENKYDEYTFRPDRMYRQTTDERTRYLNSLYKDFMKETIKKDPNFRVAGDSACETIRGTREYSSTIDC